MRLLFAERPEDHLVEEVDQITGYGDTGDMDQ